MQPADVYEVEFSETHWFKVKVTGAELAAAGVTDPARSLKCGSEPPDALGELLTEKAIDQPALQEVDGREIGRVTGPGFAQAVSYR